MRKQRIPQALREQVWVRYVGDRFSSKCTVPWCKNNITCFRFHVGHNIPESKGGRTEIGNLRPVCDRCNQSMGNHYTIDEWSKQFAPESPQCECCAIM